MKKYMSKVAEILGADLTVLREKDEQYGGSWMKRGGVGAFMMLARKWDRLEAQLEAGSPKWDVFTQTVRDTRKDGLLDDIQDLRRYLALVEAQVLTLWEEQKEAPDPGEPSFIDGSTV